jgi:adenylate cyclase
VLPSYLLNLLQRIGRIGENPADSDEVRLQKAIQVNTVVLGGLPAQFSIGIVLLFSGAYWAAVSTIGFGVLAALLLFYLAVTRRHYPFFRFTQLAIPLLSPFVSTVLMGGLIPTGFAIIWGLVAPLLALILYRPRQALYWFLAYLGLVVISGLVRPILPWGGTLPPVATTILGIVNIVGVSSLVFLSLAFFVNQRALAFRLLHAEQEKTENLLLNILPKEIAAILKDNNRVIADQIEGASILFADVVDFTPLSAGMTATELVNLLNEVFSGFDTLVDKYGLEKIKTIGDCYMVAAGVPVVRPDHAHALVRLALEMRDFVSQRDFRGQKLRFRIGINSGPVVAGVIGHKKFIYDLWGDAVNTASRMESHGKANIIQITESTYRLIEQEFLCEPQGVISIKGKGEMAVWHVLGVNL